jgi:hypothetical protein
MALGWYRATKSGAQDRPTSPSETGAFPWQAQGSPLIITVETFSLSIEKNVIVCGDLNASERQILKKNPHIQLVSPAQSVRRPALLAELAFTRWQAGDVDDVGTLAPIYLHIADPIPADSRVQAA